MIHRVLAALLTSLLGLVGLLMVPYGSGCRCTGPDLQPRWGAITLAHWRIPRPNADRQRRTTTTLMTAPTTVGRVVLRRGQTGARGWTYDHLHHFTQRPGPPGGPTGPGRSISPNYIEEVLSSTKGNPVEGPNGEPRFSYTSGDVHVITENNIVITVITR